MDLGTVISIVALVGLALVMYERLRHRHPADYQARLGPLSAATLIVSMQRRRKRAIAVAAPLGAVALALLFVARYTYPAGVRIWGFDGALLLLGAILFGTVLTTLLWGYRCPVCGQALATIGGLTLGTEGCPICASWPPGSGTAVASATRAGQRAGERGPRGGALRRVHLLAEGDRLILVKARFPRLVELVPLLGFFGLWYLFLWRHAAGAQSTFSALLIGLFGLALVVVVFDRHLLDTLRTLAVGDTFIFYRSTGRVVRNGEVLCPLSAIDRIVLRPSFFEEGGRTHLLLVLTDGRQVRVDSSASGDLRQVADALAEFIGRPVVVGPRTVPG